MNYYAAERPRKETQAAPNPSTYNLPQVPLNPSAMQSVTYRPKSMLASRRGSTLSASASARLAGPACRRPKLSWVRPLRRPSISCGASCATSPPPALPPAQLPHPRAASAAHRRPPLPPASAPSKVDASERSPSLRDRPPPWLPPQSPLIPGLSATFRPPFGVR